MIFVEPHETFERDCLGIARTQFASMTQGFLCSVTVFKTKL